MSILFWIGLGWRVGYEPTVTDLKRTNKNEQGEGDSLWRLEPSAIFTGSSSERRRRLRSSSCNECGTGRHRREQGAANTGAGRAVSKVGTTTVISSFAATKTLQREDDDGHHQPDHSDEHDGHHRRTRVQRTAWVNGDHNEDETTIRTRRHTKTARTRNQGGKATATRIATTRRRRSPGGIRRPKRRPS